MSNECHDYQEVISSLQNHMKLKPKTYLIGDFNFDKDEKRNVLGEFLANQGFLQMINRPTHEKGRTIDHLYVPKGDSENIEIHHTYPYFSDHLAICVKIKTQE